MNNKFCSSLLDCRYCGYHELYWGYIGLCRGYILGVILGLHWGQKRDNAKEDGNYNSMIRYPYMDPLGLYQQDQAKAPTAHTPQHLLGSTCIRTFAKSQPPENMQNIYIYI